VRGCADMTPLASRLERMPCVWLLEVDETPPQGDQVFEDSAGLGSSAARYLLEQGRRRLAVVIEDLNVPCYRPRCGAFAAAAERLGATVEIFGGLSPQEAVERILAPRRRPDGLFLPGSESEMSAIYRELLARGTQPGKDIGWISCSYDLPCIAALDPALANIDIRAEEIARAAVEMLLWRLQHPTEPQRRLMIAPRLVEGTLPGQLVR